MLYLALALMLAAEPVSVPEAATAPVEQAAPAAKWPAAFFFIGGGVTMWTGVGLLIITDVPRSCPLPCRPTSRTPIHTAEASLISAGVASLIAGVIWLVWARAGSES